MKIKNHNNSCFDCELSHLDMEVNVKEPSSEYTINKENTIAKDPANVIRKNNKLA